MSNPYEPPRDANDKIIPWHATVFLQLASIIQLISLEVGLLGWSMPQPFQVFGVPVREVLKLATLVISVTAFFVVVFITLRKFEWSTLYKAANISVGLTIVVIAIFIALKIGT